MVGWSAHNDKVVVGVMRPSLDYSAKDMMKATDVMWMA